ncbi:integral membrane protein [Colletotrichum graminicola]|nr:integral membrane protein [Colletotrichum graminicola]
MLGRSSAYRTTTNATCNEPAFSKNWVSPLAHPVGLYVSIANDIGPLSPLSTFHITFHLEGKDSKEISCQQANITPALSPTISSAITYSAWALFIFVLLVGIARSVSSTPINFDNDEPRPVRTVLLNVGDCLQYLEFIFFLFDWWAQPAVPRLLSNQFVEDGIYVLNGTYGLELMAQIAGVPMSMDTWLNMAILVFMVAASIALVLRVSCLAATPIVAMVAAFVWLIRQIPTRNLGALLFDSTKRYRQLPPSEDFQRQDERFIFIIFALTFVRGAVVGGLQISGVAQLAVLGACELILLASIAGFQAYSTFSVGSIAATIRLCSLVFLMAFLPGFATTTCDLASIVKTWWTAPKPDAYGLRELRRRDVSPSNLSMHTANELATSYPAPYDVEEPNAVSLRPTYRPGSPSTMRLSHSTASSRYFRLPRSSASLSSGDHPRSLGSSIYSSSRTVSTSNSITDMHSMPLSPPLVSPTPLSESIWEEVGTTSQASPTGVDSEPLGARWNDYSFREADLYYGAPRPRPTGRASEELPRPPAPRPSFRSSSGFWVKVTGQADASEQGFRVPCSRPRPEVGFVVVRPDRPNNLGDGPGGGAMRSTSPGA